MSRWAAQTISLGTYHASWQPQKKNGNLLIVHCHMRLYELNCDKNCVGYSQTEQTAAHFFFSNKDLSLFHPLSLFTSPSHSLWPENLHTHCHTCTKTTNLPTPHNWLVTFLVTGCTRWFFFLCFIFLSPDIQSPLFGFAAPNVGELGLLEPTDGGRGLPLGMARANASGCLIFLLLADGKCKSRGCVPANIG